MFKVVIKGFGKDVLFEGVADTTTYSSNELFTHVPLTGGELFVIDTKCVRSIQYTKLDKSETLQDWLASEVAPIPFGVPVGVAFDTIRDAETKERFDTLIPEVSAPRKKSKSD